MTCQIQFSERGRREFESLPLDIQRRILPKLDALAYDPRPPGVVAIAGKHKAYRIRIGDSRVVYSIDDDILLVLIVRAGHRRNVYDRR